MQRIPGDIRITEENVNNVRSSQRVIKILLWGMISFILWHTCIVAYKIGIYFLGWNNISWIGAVLLSGWHLAFALFCILLAYKRQNENSRSLCGNCVKPGLIGDSEFQDRFQGASSSLIQVQGK